MYAAGDRGAEGRGGAQCLFVVECRAWGVFGWSGDIDPGGLQAAGVDSINAMVDVVTIGGDKDAFQGVSLSARTLAECLSGMNMLALLPMDQTRG